MGGTLDVRRGIAAARWAKRKLAKPAPSVERRRQLEQAGRERAKRAADEQVRSSLEREHAVAQTVVAAGSRTQARLADKRGQLQRVNTARERAGAAGDTRGAAKLDARAARIEGEIVREQDALNTARRTVAEGESAQRRTGALHTREQREQRARFLDAQAALPAAGRAAQSGERRDYAALAGLAGYGRAQYEHLDPRHRREARAQIDRELAARRELGGAAADIAAANDAGLRWRERHKLNRDFDRALGERLREAGHTSSRVTGAGGSRHDDSPRGGSDRLENWKRADGRTQVNKRSSVMDDAREVAARRKRQLGRDHR
jgi:hypothetical protein